MWNGIDKRRFPRAKYKCAILIKRAAHPKKINTYTENIGGGGICVVLDQDIGLFHGTEIELVIEESMPAIKASGTVVWVVKKRAGMSDENMLYDTGIEFLNIKEDDRQRILSAVDDILKKENP